MRENKATRAAGLFSSRGAHHAPARQVKRTVGTSLESSGEFDSRHKSHAGHHAPFSQKNGSSKINGGRIVA